MIDQQSKDLEVNVGVTQGTSSTLSTTPWLSRPQSWARKEYIQFERSPFQVWMLTGDKVDTAINIGHSCSLLNTDMTTLRLCADDEEEGGEDPAEAAAKDAKAKGGTGGGGAGGKTKVFGKEEAVVVTVERTSLELDASGVPSEASLRG